MIMIKIKVTAQKKIKKKNGSAQIVKNLINLILLFIHIINLNMMVNLQKNMISQDLQKILEKIEEDQELQINLKELNLLFKINTNKNAKTIFMNSLENQDKKEMIMVKEIIL